MNSKGIQRPPSSILNTQTNKTKPKEKETLQLTGGSSSPDSEPEPAVSVKGDFAWFPPQTLLCSTKGWGVYNMDPAL